MRDWEERAAAESSHTWLQALLHLQPAYSRALPSAALAPPTLLRLGSRAPSVAPARSPWTSKRTEVPGNAKANASRADCVDYLLGSARGISTAARGGYEPGKRGSPLS